MIRLQVRVQPRASRDAVVGQEGGVWSVRLTAPPVEGQANDALIKLLAGVLGIPRSSISIVHGLRGRAKTLQIEGVTEEEVNRLLESQRR